MISVDDALDKILARVTPLPSETVPLAQSMGRVLARGALAHIDNPAFDVSAMDGYAARSQDTVAPGTTLRNIGTSQAGLSFGGQVGQGECVRIFTGAPVPIGADVVIMQEETETAGDQVTFASGAASGRNIRFRGEDFVAGAELVAAGQRLTARTIGLIAAGNNAHVDIVVAPRVGILATGDELVRPGDAVGPDQIVASNSTSLAALLAPFCDRIADHGIAIDDKKALATALQNALDQKPDVLITTGGASVGEHDLVQEVFEDLGVVIDFWRIAMRPGKPLMFGTYGKTLVFGLPGNPVSALVTARLFIVPAMLAMAGAKPQPPLFLPLAKPLPANGPRRHFLRGRLVNDRAGFTAIDPIAQTDSGHLSSLAKADVLIVQRENCSGKNVGDYVETILI